MMILRFFAFLLALPVAVAALVAPALAQYSQPSPYYREGPRTGIYQEQLPPPGAAEVEPSGSTGDRGGPQRVLPYPEEDAAIPPPPGFAIPKSQMPSYDQQVEGQQRRQQQQQQQQQQPAASASGAEPGPMRPPGLIGPAPQAAPPAVTAALPPEDQPEQGQPKELPENLKRQLVHFNTKEPAGTIIIDTPNTYLYLVLGHGQAIRYGIGVGREGFTWSGTERISKMKEWPDWFPPSEMIERQPYLPRMMAGGPGNPLGARALYLGKTLYRIHGTNQPSTIGQTVSSGCIRLLNEDIEDLFSRVQVGTRVVVLPGKSPETTVNAANPSAANGHVPIASGRAHVAPQSGTAISGAPLPAVR
jgi:lipoprotein-anchoring transpeptidase ErfK/SrfK